jgi:hypothetical protein
VHAVVEGSDNVADSVRESGSAVADGAAEGGCGAGDADLAVAGAAAGAHSGGERRGPKDAVLSGRGEQLPHGSNVPLELAQEIGLASV